MPLPGWALTRTGRGIRSQPDMFVILLRPGKAVGINYNTRILRIDELYLFFIHRLTEPAMSVSALHIYEQLTDAPDDKTRARIIAEAIGQLEDRYPQLREVATQSQLRETELRLQKEIQVMRLEIKEVEAKLQKEIKEVEAHLSKEIHLLDLKIAENTGKIAETKAELVRWVVGVGLLQTTLISGILLRVAHLI